MTNSLQHISLLYELSTTTLKYFEPSKTAKNFITKLLSRKNLNYGAIWVPASKRNENLVYEKLFSMPKGAIQKAVISLEMPFNDEAIINTNQSIFGDEELIGDFAYIKLGEIGILELFTKNSPEKLSKETLYPFLDVFGQLAISLESGYSYQKLQQEINQRKLAERSLKNNQEKYRRIVDNIKLGLLEVDTKGVINHANKSFCDLVGYTEQEILGKNATELFLNVENQGEMKRQDGVREQGESSVYELQIQTKDQGDKWIIISGAPNIDYQGKLIGSIGIHLDISDQKKLLEEYAFQENKLNNLFEVSLDALITIDENGNIVEWNPQAENVFGFMKEEVMGKKLSEVIIPHSFRDAHESGMKKFHVTKDGPVLNKRIEITALRKNGIEFPIELTIFPVEHNDKHFFTAFVRDITELKESRETMTNALKKQKELNSLKSQFVSMTSHELRTPLTTISTDMELLNFYVEQTGEVKIDKFKNILSRVGINLGRLNDLINNILLVGQLDAHKVPFKPQVYDIEKLINDQILNNYSNRERSLKYTKKGKSFDLSVDRKLFIQIIDNLVSNAYKYSEQCDPPELILDFQNEALVIDVIDHGIGIPEDELSKMFGKFFRASNVGSVQGSGLGLSIVNDFVKLHNGEIKLKSKMNVGTTFTVTFPKK